MSELFPQVFPLFEQQYEWYVQCQLEFRAIDFEEKENVNFERMRVSERQSFDNAIECGND